MTIHAEAFTESRFLASPHAGVFGQWEKVSFFQSAGFPRLYEGIPGHTFLRVVATDHNKELLSCMLVHISGSPGWMRYLTTKAVVWHGPVWGISPSSEVLASMLETLHRTLPRHTLFCQFRNQSECPEELTRVFSRMGYRFADRLNLITPITDIQATREQFSASRRREIRQSLLNGMTLQVHPTAAQIDAFYGILKDLYTAKVHKPLPPPEIFHRLNAEIQQEKTPGIFVICLYQGHVAGGMAAPASRHDTLFEYYICGLDAELRPKGVFPSVMATWWAMEEGNRMGYSFFDFMGMGVPQKSYGVREFKARFGGKWINPGRWNRRHHLSLYFIAEILYNIFIYLRSKINPYLRVLKKPD